VEPQPEMPPEYIQLTEAELCRRISAAKATLGETLCILGHHYQREEVIQFADFVGDSLKLSQQAAAQRKAKYVVFCGVHFMAESADVLAGLATASPWRAGPDQVVILPNLNAGCAMADMADEPAVAAALEELAGLGGGKVVPVVYVNSAAAVKALAARAGGACCTSSNARNVFAWALAPASAGGAGADKVLAVPDQHLGRNSAVAMGYSLDQCVLYDPAKLGGGLSRADVARAKFILWKGQCHIHQVFRPAHVEAARRRHPGIRVLAHPECPYEVVSICDASGSTEQIIREVAAAPPGSSFAIATESNLVERLARRHRDRFIRTLADFPAICRQMYCIDLPHLLWVLDNLLAGRVVNRVRVEPAIAADARVALQRMLGIRPAMEMTRRRS
jgi:quinolinate synthase